MIDFAHVSRESAQGAGASAGAAAFSEDFCDDSGGGCDTGYALGIASIIDCLERVQKEHAAPAAVIC